MTELEEVEVVVEKTQREIEDEIKRKKERQIFLDDVGVAVAMISITLLAVVVVILKVLIFDPPAPDPSVVTFKPLSQQEYSIIKYTANGYIPCNGYVPCKKGEGEENT